MLRHIISMKKLLLLLIIALGGGGLYAYKREWFGTPPKAPGIPGQFTPLASAEVRDIEFSIQVSGDVQPATQLDVKPEVGGRLKKLDATMARPSWSENNASVMEDGA